MKIKAMAEGSKGSEEIPATTLEFSWSTLIFKILKKWKCIQIKNLKSAKSMLINSVQQEWVIQTKGAHILSLGNYKGLFGFILIQGDFVILIFTFVIARCDSKILFITKNLTFQ